MSQSTSSMSEASIKTICGELQRELFDLFDLLIQNVEEAAYQVPYLVIREKYLSCQVLVRRLRDTISEPLGDSGTIYEHMQYRWFLERQAAAGGARTLEAQRARLEQAQRRFRYVTAGAETRLHGAPSLT
ncbi:hypothetical protein CCYA_CCYA03G0816 [Cyanidiococcus yangmingshanensis]|nr:hypothetical protein CCYA_CCYA03G0816 [Cyanidiococcus yangmingshanensis]